MAYNSISHQSLNSLLVLKRLKILDLTGNSLTQLPNDMARFIQLEELVLTDNNFGGKSKEHGCVQLLKSLG
jgi:Leucine-rich repeat (LRR) protein